MALLQNVIARGTHAARPAAGSQGVIYVESDTGRIFRDSGSAWVALDAVTTAGDLIYFDGTNLTRLGIGSSSQVLTVSGGAPAWAAASSGALTELADNVVSGSSTTTVTFSSISGSYTTLMIVLTGRCDEATTWDFSYLRLNNDTGSSYDGSELEVATSSSVLRSTNATKMQIHEVPGSSAPSNAGSGAVLWIPHYADTTFWKAVSVQGALDYGTNSPGLTLAGGVWKSTAAVTQIDLIAPASSHWVAGTHARLFALS